MRTATLLLAGALLATGPAWAAPISCSNSPFGNSLLLTADQEIYSVSAFGPDIGFGLHGRLDSDGSFDQERDGLFNHSPASSLDLAIVAADMEGDGHAELIAAFPRSGDNKTTVIAVDPEGNSNSVNDEWFPGGTGFTNYVLAAGNIFRFNGKREQVILASFSASGQLTVLMQADPGAEGDGVFFDNDGFWYGSWFSPVADGNYSRTLGSNRRNLDMAIGDLDQSGHKDEIAVVGVDGNGATNVSIIEINDGLAVSPNYRMARIASFNVPGASPRRLAIDTGDIDGDGRDEIIVMTDSTNPGGDGTAFNIKTYRMLVPPEAEYNQAVSNGSCKNSDTSSACIIQLQSGFIPASFFTADMTVGDTDGDNQEEIVLVFSDSLLTYVTTLDSNASASSLFYHNQTSTGANQLDGVDNISVTTADIENDGFQQILVAFNNDRGDADMARFIDSTNPGGGIQHIIPQEDLDQNIPRGVTFRKNDAPRPLIAVGDNDSDSIFANFKTPVGQTVKCQQVQEQQVASISFVPPFWETINSQNSDSSERVNAFIGKSETVESGTDTSVTAFNSHSINGYVGLGVDTAAFTASVKKTAAYEYGSSKTISSGATNGITSSEGWQNFNDYLVVETSIYNCYNYQFEQDGSPLDGRSRMCELQSTNELAPELLTWDTDPAFRSAQGAQYSWAPAVREWSNLTYINGTQAVQSSTVQPAQNAIDHTDSLSETSVETNPWLMLDLGVYQGIGKVRMVNRTDARGLDLNGYSVFVGSEDFRTLPNDPAVLANHPSVSWSKINGGQANRVTTFVTRGSNQLEVNGRYVKVMLTGNKSLSLKELEVFGRNHLEPDQFPRKVSDAGGGKIEVEIYDPATSSFKAVQFKGRLLFNGQVDEVLKGKLIGPGGGSGQWELSDFSATSTQTSATDSFTISHGIQIEAELGIVAQLQFGGGSEWSTGVETEESRSLSVTNSFEIGAFVPGFPATVEGLPVTWPAQCTYQIRPYYYIASTESDYGIEHRYLVVDYVVPDTDLNRNEDMAACKAPPPTPPPPPPPTAFLVAHWTFDGDLLDDSGNNNNGIANGPIGFSNGILGQALDLRFGNAWVDIDTGVLNSFPSCTMTAWVNLNSDAPGDPNETCCNAIFADDGFTRGAMHFNQALFSEPDTFEFSVAGLQRGQIIPAPKGTWAHYAYTYDSATGDSLTYLNGELVDQSNSTENITCGRGDDSNIGAWDRDRAGDMTRFFNGQIDDMRIYSKALNSLLIKDLSTGQPPGENIFCSNFEAFENGQCQ
jgi:hypothetical protein